MTTVRHGDKHPVTLKVNADLTGSTVKVNMRRQYTDELFPFEVAITDPAAGEITHLLTGDLDVGTYELEAEVTTGAQVRTYPTAGFQYLRVTPTID